MMARTQWIQFCKEHFQMHVLWRKALVFILTQIWPQFISWTQIQPQFVSKNLFVNKSALVQLVA